MQDSEKAQIRDLVEKIEKIADSVSEHIRRSDNFDTSVAKDIANIFISTGKLEALITENYVRKEQFEPVKNIVYGMVSVTLLAVLGGVIALVVK